MTNMLTLLAQAADEPIHLQPGGVIIMSLSIGIVLLLTGFCTYRILRDRKTGSQR